MQFSPRGRSKAAPSRTFIEIDRVLRLGDVARATALARQALDGGQIHPVLFNLRAQEKKSNGQMEAALADLMRARELDPKSAVIVSEIAGCLNWLGRHDEALAAADRALAIDRKLGDAWYQKAMAHAALTAYDAARKAFRESVRRDPTLVEAQAQLASFEAGQGNFAAARQHAEAALRLSPNNPTALAAQVSADLAEGKLCEAEAILQSMLRDAALAPPLRAGAAAQLGDLRDLQGQPDKAFGAYREARKTWAAFYESEIRRRAGEMGNERVRRLAAFVERQPPKAKERRTHDAHRG